MTIFLFLCIAVGFMSLVVLVSMNVLETLGKKYNDKPEVKSNPPKWAKLSKPAKRLYQEFEALPEDSRGGLDIVAVLTGLDERTSLDSTARDYHFIERTPYSTAENFLWKPSIRASSRCTHKTIHCKFRAYVELHEEIESLSASVKQKQRAELEARTAHVNSDVEDMLARLRTERELNNEYAKRFKELS